MQKTGGLAIFAVHIIVKLLLKINQIMLPGGGTVVAFCGRILALGRWNLRISWCKCPGVPQGQPPVMAADKCINQNL